MKRFVLILVAIFPLFWACSGALQTRTVYLSPPPDVLYDAAVAIIKEMGFSVTSESKEQQINTGASMWGGKLEYNSPFIKAKKQAKASDKPITIRLYFERKNVDTIVGIDINQPGGNPVDLEKIRDEIEIRLRAVKKASAED